MTTTQKFPLQNEVEEEEEEDGYHDDSGLASSFEENMVLTPGGKQAAVKTKAKRKTKKRTKHFEMANDLIFDLDI